MTNLQHKNNLIITTDRTAFYNGNNDRDRIFSYRMYLQPISHVQDSTITHYYDGFFTQEVFPTEQSPHYRDALFVLSVSSSYIENECSPTTLKDHLNTHHKMPRELSIYITNYVQEWQKDRQGKNQLLNALEQIICKMIISALHAEDEVTLKSDLSPEVTKAIEYMYLNFHYKLTLEDISKDCNMSAQHFSRQFLLEMNQPVLKYLNTLRIERARDLLLEKTLTINEIAHSCGFNSASYFAKKFHEHYGLTPKKYQERTINDGL